MMTMIQPYKANLIVKVIEPNSGNEDRKIEINTKNLEAITILLWLLLIKKELRKWLRKKGCI